jgi:hypothetical protein
VYGQFQRYALSRCHQPLSSTTMDESAPNNGVVGLSSCSPVIGSERCDDNHDIKSRLRQMTALGVANFGAVNIISIWIDSFFLT